MACFNYARALKEVGIDGEMVYIRLVSSIEILSKCIELNKKDNPLCGIKFDKLFTNCKLTVVQLKQLKEILMVDRNSEIATSKIKLKFLRFIEKYSKEYFKGGKWKVKEFKIKKSNLRKNIGTIYDSPSKYLHVGEIMYLNQFMYGAEKLNTDPSVGMIIDNRNFPASEKLPYIYWFENIVRHCLIKYLVEKTGCSIFFKKPEVYRINKEKHGNRN